MANYFLPDRFGAPELITPQERPNGPMEVDWTHPLADKLIAYWIFPDLTNIVDGQPIVLQNGTPEDRGDHRWFDVASTEYYRTANTVEMSNQFTLFVDFDINTIAAARAGIYISDNSDSFGLDTRGGWDQHFFVNGTNLFGETSLSHLRHLSIGTYNASSNMSRVFFNDVEAANWTVSKTTPSAPHIYIGANYSSSAPLWHYDGQIFKAGVFDRELSIEEAKAFALDPFQILKPARPAPIISLPTTATVGKLASAHVIRLNNQ